MNTKTLMLAVSSLILASSLHAEAQPSAKQGAASNPFGKTPWQLLEEWDRSATRYHAEPPQSAPHWTDPLVREPKESPVALGVKYGGNYGQEGALKPVPEDAMGPVGFYVRTSF
jgi:hypothetical protein